MKLEDIITKKMKYSIMKVAWPIVEHLNNMFTQDSAPVTQEHWMYLHKNLKKGDIVLSTKANNPGNFILPGKAKHASMVIDDNPDNPILIEAVSKGVVKTSLYEFMKTKNYLVHCRSSYFSPETAALASRIAAGMEGVKYDHVWSPDNNWIYCSELVYESYKKAFLEKAHLPTAFPLVMKERCGEMTYIPDDIRLDHKCWDILWSNISTN